MRRKLLVAAGFGVLLLALPAIFLAMRWSDIPPPDDSDLTLPVRQIDSSQNPYPLIRAFEIDAADRDAIGRAWEMTGGDGGEKPDEAFIDGLLTQHAETLRQFDQYARMNDWRQDQELAVDTEVHHLNNWFAIARLKALESGKALSDGETGRALLSGISILRFAKGIHQAEGGFIHQLVAASIAGLGMVAILDVVESGRLSADQLVHLDRILASPMFSVDTLAKAFVVEYRIHRQVADDLAAGKIHVHQLRTVELNDEPAHPPGRFFYKRNQTVQMLANASRQFIEEAAMIRSRAREQPIAEAERFRDNAGELYVSGNLIGRILFSVVVPTGKRVSDQFSLLQVRLDLLRARVALERYRKEHGDWPTDLESLVPGFLKSVPVDLMDGNAIRYSRKDRVIYSVGLDFVEHGAGAREKSGFLAGDEEVVIKLPAAWTVAN